MAKILMLSLIMATIFTATGCTRPNKATDEENQKIIDVISYIKDPNTGLCFATIKSQSSNGYQVISITNIPCEKVY